MALQCIKVQLDGKLRVMQISHPLCFAATKGAIAQAHGISDSDDIKLTYADSDGDQVSCTTPGRTRSQLSLLHRFWVHQ